MKFNVYKHPRLNFFGLIGVFSFFIAIMIALALVLLSQQTKQLGIGIFCFGICILCFAIPLVLSIRLKADYFAEFSIDPDGITVCHEKNGTHKILWSEIVDSGIIQKDYESSFSHPKFVYFSKTKLTKKDFFRLNCCAKATLLCAECQDEILWKVRDYFPICLDVKRIKIPGYAKKAE